MPQPEEECFVIAGLGNPGPRYDLTPHNLGFLTVDRLAAETGIRVNRPEANSLVGLGEAEGRRVVLAKPLSFMNRSGPPLRQLLERYEQAPERLLVIYDDLALPWGTMRLRERGSAGGHHGVESIIEALRTTEFNRLRLGIHPGHPVGDGAAYVLRQFTRSEREELNEILQQAAEAVRLFLSEGAAKAMAVYNRRAQGPEEAEEA